LSEISNQSGERHNRDRARGDPLLEDLGAGLTTAAFEVREVAPIEVERPSEFFLGSPVAHT
jgi:hypothetical protein